MAAASYCPGDVLILRLLWFGIQLRWNEDVWRLGGLVPPSRRDGAAGLRVWCSAEAFEPGDQASQFALLKVGTGIVSAAYKNCKPALVGEYRLQ